MGAHNGIILKTDKLFNKNNKESSYNSNCDKDNCKVKKLQNAISVHCLWMNTKNSGAICVVHNYA